MIKDFDLLQRANNDYTTIDLEHAEELAYRELIDSIRYISLGDECGVMGNIANIITYKGRFYIQEEQFDRVFIYDDTGRCLNTLYLSAQIYRILRGAYSTVRLADLPDEQREYIESITLDTGTNMLSELQLLIAKEADLQSKIAKIENGDPDALYIDRVVEMCAPKSTERLEQQQEKLETLRRKRDDLTWEIDSGPDGKPPSKAKQKQLDALQREIAALEDTTADRQMELEKSSYKVNMQTVIKASAFDRAMKLEAELNKIHGRIIKLLDSIKGYEMESRRLRLEERKYNLAKQKLSGAFDVDPETGEIIDEVDDPCGDPEI